MRSMGSTSFKTKNIEGIFNKSLAYPNPAKDQLYLNLYTSCVIEVYDFKGNRVFVKDGVIGNNTINVTNLKQGLYLLKAGEYSYKFIISK